MKVTKCRKCAHLEPIDSQKGWHLCLLKDLKIHWKWAVNPPEEMPEIRYCDKFQDKEKNPYRCYNDPEYYKKV